MKLLFTQDALVNAGAERSHLEILSRFSKELDVSLVYFYHKHELKDAYERAGIRLFFLDIPESYHFPIAVSRMVRLIRREKPDLLISSLWRADIITRLASFITGVPVIGTLVNDSYSPIAWTDKKGLKFKLVYWLDRMTAGIPIHWIANAQALADSHVRTLGLSPDKISVVYRGRSVIAGNVIASEARAACPEFISGKQSHSDENASSSSGEANQSPESKTASATEYPENKPKTPESSLAVTSPTIRNFITYGRLLERKGFQDAIQAFSQVIKTYPDCTLTIYGEGPYRKELEKLIQDLDLSHAVFLPGKIQNPVEALIHGYCPKSGVTLSTLPTRVGKFEVPLFTAHCFLFPSWYEGFSGALVEAMMAGIPIIASDIPMNLEAVESEKSALVFPVGNCKILEEKMTYAIEHADLMLELGDQARIISSQKFDINVIAKQYEETLLRIYRQRKSKKA